MRVHGIGFWLPEFCYIFRDDQNSDIAVEIENMEGFAIVPSLSEEEALRRLKKLIPLAVMKTEIIRI